MAVPTALEWARSEAMAPSLQQHQLRIARVGYEHTREVYEESAGWAEVKVVVTFDDTTRLYYTDRVVTLYDYQLRQMSKFEMIARLCAYQRGEEWNGPTFS